MQKLFYNIVVVFVIHRHESAMDIHVFPIPIPPPTSLSTRSLWVFPVHQVRADSHETGFSHHRVWAPGQRGFCISSVWALEHRLVVVLYRLICPEACEIFPDQKSNPCPLHWQGNFFTAGPPVSSQASLLVDICLYLY